MILVGTSGWQYDDWRGRFYPKELPKTRWLDYFAARFPTVEVNNTFYRLPEERSFDRWRDGTPADFVITVKANRFITHIKRMKDSADALETFWSRASRLGDKIGPVLFQLPPRFRADHERLAAFCELLPSQMRAAFEFRDPEWETPQTYEILDRAGASFVLADWPQREAPDVVCAGWSYVRFHKGSTVRVSYSAAKLRRWADRLAAMGADPVYVYFNNDPGGAALRDARTLTKLLAERAMDVRGPADGALRRAG